MSVEVWRAQPQQVDKRVQRALEFKAYVALWQQDLDQQLRQRLARLEMVHQTKLVTDQREWGMRLAVKLDEALAAGVGDYEREVLEREFYRFYAVTDRIIGYAGMDMSI